MGFLDHMNGQVLNAHDKADKALEMLDQQTELLADILQNTRAETLRESVRRIPAQAVADASGVATIALQVPQGIAWNLISIAITGGVAAQGGCFVYLNSNEPMNLIRVLSYAQRVSDDFCENEYVPQGATVVIEFVGQPAGQVCTANLKIQNLREA